MAYFVPALFCPSLTIPVAPFPRKDFSDIVIYLLISSNLVLLLSLFIIGIGISSGLNVCDSVRGVWAVWIDWDGFEWFTELQGPILIFN